MADKKTCFVIMPFGDSKTRARYDSFYTDVYKPGIEAGGLDAYRVDKDRKAREPVAAIHKKIQEAHVCFADISTNRPNVWYELGYAYACRKEVVLVYKTPRSRFPFDLNHKRLLDSPFGSPDDFSKLKEEIKKEIVEVAQMVDEAAVPIVGHHSSAHAPDTDMPKLTDLDIKVLGAIVRICSDGETFAFLRTIVRELRRACVSPLPDRQELQETIEVLTDYGLIEKAGSSMYNKKLIAHKPTLKGKKCHRGNRT